MSCSSCKLHHKNVMPRHKNCPPQRAVLHGCCWHEILVGQSNVLLVRPRGGACLSGTLPCDCTCTGSLLQWSFLLTVDISDPHSACEDHAELCSKSSLNMLPACLDDQEALQAMRTGYSSSSPARRSRHQAYKDSDGGNRAWNACLSPSLSLVRLIFVGTCRRSGLF